MLRGTIVKTSTRCPATLGCLFCLAYDPDHPVTLSQQGATLLWLCVMFVSGDMDKPHPQIVPTDIFAPTKHRPRQLSPVFPEYPRQVGLGVVIGGVELIVHLVTPF